MAAPFADLPSGCEPSREAQRAELDDLRVGDRDPHDPRRLAHPSCINGPAAMPDASGAAPSSSTSHMWEGLAAMCVNESKARFGRFRTAKAAHAGLSEAATPLGRINHVSSRRRSSPQSPSIPGSGTRAWREITGCALSCHRRQQICRLGRPEHSDSARRLISQPSSVRAHYELLFKPCRAYVAGDAQRLSRWRARTGS
jgi:hypothetical protein